MRPNVLAYIYISFSPFCIEPGEEDRCTRCGMRDSIDWAGISVAQLDSLCDSCGCVAYEHSCRPTGTILYSTLPSPSPRSSLPVPTHFSLFSRFMLLHLHCTRKIFVRLLRSEISLCLLIFSTYSYVQHVHAPLSTVLGISL